MKKIKIVISALVLLFGALLASCDLLKNSNQGNLSGEETSATGTIHNHTFDTNWTNDENYHWHAATCGHDAVSEKDILSLLEGWINSDLKRKEELV